MSNSTFENLGKKSKKETGWKLKLTTGLPPNVAENITLHDVFTVLLIIMAIIIVLVV